MAFSPRRSSARAAGPHGHLKASSGDVLVNEEDDNAGEWILVPFKALDAALRLRAKASAEMGERDDLFARSYHADSREAHRLGKRVRLPSTLRCIDADIVCSSVERTRQGGRKRLRIALIERGQVVEEHKVFGCDQPVDDVNEGGLRIVQFIEASASAYENISRATRLR